VLLTAVMGDAGARVTDGCNTRLLSITEHSQHRKLQRDDLGKQALEVGGGAPCQVFCDQHASTDQLTDQLQRLVALLGLTPIQPQKPPPGDG
jgi:hypothetical protein